MLKVFGVAAAIVLFLLVALGLAITIIPHFLDRVYYEGPKGGHFTGERFFNPGRDDTTEPPVGNSRGGFFLRYIFGRDGRPPWPDRVAITPVKPPARVDGERMVVTWIGHATMLIQTQGLNFLTDPIWSEKTGPFGLGARRVIDPAVRFEDLPKIDAVLLSHNHYDHFDLPTLKRLIARDNPRIFTGLGNDKVLGTGNVTTLDWGQGATVGPGIDVIAVRAHHWSTRWMSDRNRALWAGFVIKLPGGNVWFAGDTGMGDGQWPAEAASHGPIRLAFIPIGAFRFVPGQMAIASHIGPVDAVEVYRRSGAAHAIAIHWGTFRLSFEARETPPKLLAAAMKCTGQEGYEAPPVGSTVEVPPYSPPRPVTPMTRDALLRCLDTPEVRALQ